MAVCSYWAVHSHTDTVVTSLASMLLVKRDVDLLGERV